MDSMSLFDTLDSFPIWIYWLGLLCQFVVFPYLSWYGSVKTFNVFLAVYLLKDFLFDLDLVLTLHHLATLVFLYTLGRFQSDIRAAMIAEIGSGVYNIYTLSQYYNAFVSPAYMLYAIVMTFSNVYCVCYVVKKETHLINKIVAFVLLAGRQYYVL